MNEPARRGRFITLEGGEGCGKSTQARLLAEHLRGYGRQVVLTREPGGTPGAEAVRGLLLDLAQEWGLRAEALLFAAARADHVEKLILPALARGDWVICDRFIDSSRAYQGAAEALSDDDIIALHAIGSDGLMPDVTLLLTCPDVVARARVLRRDEGLSDRIGGRPRAFHDRVSMVYEKLANDEPARIKVIDGAGDPQAVHQRVLAALGL